MARISKRALIEKYNENAYADISTEKTLYKTAIYARLSGEDRYKGNGDTLSTQIFLIEKYIENKPDLKHIRTFTDNGVSGTDFERPGFDEMMQAIKRGEINCVVVKDLSRFGRNYIEAGTYMETIFPFMGVRFIAINDNYDSNEPMDANKQLSVSIKNLTNERYARDISKKILASIDIMMHNGDYLGGLTPYGYLKNPEDIHKLIKDPVTASVVEKIFMMKAERYSDLKIVDWLNTSGIDCPYEYKKRIGIYKKNLSEKRKIWQVSTVKGILVNPIYIGNMVQGKYRMRKFEKEKYIKMDKKDWIIVEGTHEPIISIEIWNKVQEVVAETKAYHNEHYGKKIAQHKPNYNIFKGKLYCGQCGHTMKRCMYYTSDNTVTYAYRCNYRNVDATFCDKAYIKEELIKETVYNTLKLQMKLCCDYKGIIKQLEESEYCKKHNSDLEVEYKSIMRDRDRLTSKKAVLYDSYIAGKISKEEYIQTARNYDSDIEKYNIAIQEIEDKISKRIVVSEKNEWVEAFSKFTRKKKLSKEMLDTLVKRIIIYGRDRIEIEFNFKDEFNSLVQGINEMEEVLYG